MAGDRRLTLNPKAWHPDDLLPACEWLRAGGIVAFPTDTYYGLAVDPRSDDAVSLLFEVKGRDPKVAMPLIAASPAQVRETVGALSGHDERLAKRYWPGPLSLVFLAPPGISVRVHGGAGTIAVRVPDHEVARKLAAGVGHLVTATSANRSGAPPVRRADDLDEVRDNPRVFVVDAGETPGGQPSTIVDARGLSPVLVREGAIAWNRVLESLNG